MYIETLELNNYRNYENLNIMFDQNTNILYGDNAQGKTNILDIWLQQQSHIEEVKIKR